MKNKLCKFILTICLIIVFPMLVNADMGAPESYQYDVIITNPNGATATTWEGGEEVEDFFYVSIHQAVRLDGTAGYEAVFVRRQRAYGQAFDD
jgi:hypothetical protein